MIKKKNISLLFNLFLFMHLVVWTLVPLISNTNLPLDVIEALAWGSNLNWGFEKHPPLSAFFPEIFYQIFGRQDWAYYLLSQIFVVFSFVVIFKLAKEFLKNEVHALLSVLLLEGVLFYNFTTPEFNVNICQMPFWTLTVYYFWKCIKDDKIKNWALLGLFAALGILSKYLFVYLLLGMLIFFIFKLMRIKKFNYKYFISILVFLLVLTPHFIWLVDNNFKTIVYGLKRTGLESVNFLDHLFYPFKFTFKQIGILLPFFGLMGLIVTKFKFLSFTQLIISATITGDNVNPTLLKPEAINTSLFFFMFPNNGLPSKLIGLFPVTSSIFALCIILWLEISFVRASIKYFTVAILLYDSSP